VQRELADLEGIYGKKVDFVVINIEKVLDAEQRWWLEKFRVDAVPVVALIKTNRTAVQTEYMEDFPNAVLAANIKALSEGQELPFDMIDAFKGRKLELPK